MIDRPRVLIVDDEEQVQELLAETLAQCGCQVTTAGTGTKAVELINGHRFDAAFLNIRTPELDGLELFREIKRHDPTIDVVMLTDYPGIRAAVEALKEGAYYYLTKPLILDDLPHLMSRVMELRFLRQEVSSLQSRLGELLAVRASSQMLPAADSPHPRRRWSDWLVGDSPQMLRVKEVVAKVNATNSPVIVEGESGTGKEMVATAIHRFSARNRGPFIPVNCGAIPPDLLESEFFGHVRGAFSGAVTEAPGLYRSANGGTIFLDEIAELPPALQVKLLRVLEEKEIRPVGSTKTYTVDVRVIAATNRRLEEAIKDGSFRQDLFYRLNVVRITMPPLREHKTDIPALVAHFLSQFNRRFGQQVKGITQEAMAALMAYDFPGNVRELENFLERAYVLGVRDEITLADLPALAAPRQAPQHSEELPKLAQAERELILRALQLHDNDKRQAAKMLGISYRTIYRRLKEYGLVSSGSIEAAPPPPPIARA